MPDLVSHIRERASKNPRRIVFPEATDPRVLIAVTRLVTSRMARPILVGSRTAVEKKAAELGLRLSQVEIVDVKSTNLVDRYSRMLLPDWKSRGVTEMEAQQRLEDPMYFAAAMVRAGDADGFVGGAATTTAETVRAAIRCIGLRPSSKTVSSFFWMALPA